ncbi:hypothetical protein BgiBS90_000967, partial [Biomphalaria glabrata]
MTVPASLGTTAQHMCSGKETIRTGALTLSLQVRRGPLLVVSRGATSNDMGSNS